MTTYETSLYSPLSLSLSLTKKKKSTSLNILYIYLVLVDIQILQNHFREQKNLNNFFK